MASPNSQLSPKAAKVKEWLDAKFKVFKCPLCSFAGIGVGEIVCHNSFENGPMIGDDSTYSPRVELTCGNCAFVLQFDAKKLGLV